MKRVPMLLAVVLAIVLAGSAGSALADGGRGVAVKPLTPRAGETIVVKGDLLGKGEVEVRVIGRGIDVDLGEVELDAEGDFRSEFRLPADLPPGTYTVRVKGQEMAQTEITVMPAAGTLGAAPMGEMEMSPVRERSTAETIGLVALFGAIAALGLFFARSAGRTVAS